VGNPWPSLTLGTSPGARSVTAPGDGPHRFHRRRRPRCCIASPGAAANQLVADIPAGQMWAAPLVNAQRTRRPNTAFSTTPARDRSPAAFTNDGLWTRNPLPRWSLHRGTQRATLRTETPPLGPPIRRISGLSYRLPEIFTHPGSAWFCSHPCSMRLTVCPDLKSGQKIKRPWPTQAACADGAEQLVSVDHF